MHICKDYFKVLCACAGDSNDKSVFCVEDKFNCDELRLKFTTLLLLLQLAQKLFSNWLSDVACLAASLVWSSTTMMGVDALERTDSSGIAESSSAGSPIVKRLVLGFIISNNHFKNATNINVICVHRNPAKRTTQLFRLSNAPHTYMYMPVHRKYPWQRGTHN